MNEAMTVFSHVAILAAALVLGGCGDGNGDGDGTHPEPDAGVSDSGSEGPLFCPNPDDPGVHYIEVDPSRCQPDQLSCTVDQYGFHNACGCGCIDHGDPTCPDPQNPDVRFFSRDPAQCSGTPACALNELSFSNSCGCGCLLQG